VHQQVQINTLPQSALLPEGHRTYFPGVSGWIVKMPTHIYLLLMLMLLYVPYTSLHHHDGNMFSQTVWPLMHAPYTVYQYIQPNVHGETFAFNGRFSYLYSKGFRFES
jgi:hypothetical protein